MVIVVLSLSPCFLQDDEDVGRATGAGEVQDDFISSLSRISQLRGTLLFSVHLTSIVTDNPGFSDPIFAELTSECKTSTFF
jgi:hypothetical protein